MLWPEPDERCLFLLQRARVPPYSRLAPARLGWPDAKAGVAGAI